MKILLVSERFHPSVGGVETVTRLLGEAFVALGHSVSVVTRESALGAPASRRRGPAVGESCIAGETAARPGHTDGLVSKFPFKVWRQPGPVRLLREYAAAQVVIVQGAAARLAWPLLWISRKALMVHHMAPAPGKDWLGEGVRARLAGRVRHVAVSRALGRVLPWPIETVVPNPYDDATFRVDHGVSRDRDIVFVGRLIPAKGAHVLIEALGLLRFTGMAITATIVGEGPERTPLTELINARELDDRVHVVGQVTGSPLAKLLNQHRVLVIPSLSHEAFGLVALEGIACGCTLVGSDVGGLPEAIGPCGISFPGGDVVALATRIEALLYSTSVIEKLRSGAAQHLAPHRPSAVAQTYLNFAAKSTPVPLNCGRTPRISDEGHESHESSQMAPRILRAFVKFVSYRVSPSL